MSPQEFYEMRLKHFFLKIQEYNRNKEADIRFAAEQTRLQTTALINVQLKSKDRLKPPQLWPLPWDNEHIEQLTGDDVKQLYDSIRSKDNSE